MARWAGIEFPYVEGLRLDEAMHPLALLAVGLVRRNAAQSGRRAHPAGGAVEIRVQEREIAGEDPPGGRSSRPPPGTLSAPNEYGFYSNVNPQWIIRAGARPKNAVWANCSTAIP